MYDTYQQVWNRVLNRCPVADPSLCQDWVTNTFRDLVERREWSWGWSYGEFLFNQVTTPTGGPGPAGTGVNLTFNNPTVTGVGTSWTTALQGQQFRTGAQSPIYTVLSVNVGAQTLLLTLDGQNTAPWGGANYTNTAYQIYNAYQTVPANFKEFISVVDPQMNWRLRTNVQKVEIDTIDPQRSNVGVSYCVVEAAYTYAVAASSSGQVLPLARYEWWPHQQSQYVYPYIYSTQPPDLQDSNATLPRMVRGDVLLEGALAQCAMWPGPSVDKPNPYYNLQLALRHEQRFERMVAELEIRDDALFSEDVKFLEWQSLPFAVIPMLDSRWLQQHSI